MAGVAIASSRTAAEDIAAAAEPWPIAVTTPAAVVEQHAAAAPLAQQRQSPMLVHPHRAQQPPMPAHRVARLPPQLHVAAVAAAKPAAAVVVDMPVPAAHHAAAAVVDTSNL